MLYACARVIREIIIAWLIRLFTTNDTVRHKMLETVAREIKGKRLSGCVAELGVYKGDFARFINHYFPAHKLYLFDTFDGFDERDVEIENCYDNHAQKNDFTNKDVNLVLKKMKYPANCVIKKGWFPETARDVDERFLFVSIDADLYEPIYQGLLYFYPRLERGGYIFVHDYNGEVYDGAKKAVHKFSSEYNVPYVPLNDLCGSVVFSK